MAAYYNEIDEYAAQWIRNLIAAGLVPAGDVDTRSIEDVRPDDLRGYAQCHFFAGIAGWGLALRLAGWPDDRPVWTGSCPCQPFSSAGKRGSFDDERHLWPAWFRLIAECRPPVVLGEQVASKDGLAWLDLVSADMEGADYAFAALDLCAAGVGAPHIRQRLWFVGIREGLEHSSRDGRLEWRPESSGGRVVGGCGDGRLGLSDGDGPTSRREGPEAARHGDPAVAASGVRGLADSNGISGAQEREGHDVFRGQRAPVGRGQLVAAGPRAGSGDGGGDHSAGVARRWDGTDPGALRDFCRLADDLGKRLEGLVGDGAGIRQPGRVSPGSDGPSAEEGASGGPRPTDGFWRDPDWLFCRDGKWRPVEPGTFPLAHVLPAGMGKLCPELRRLAGVAGLDAASLKRAKSYRIGALRGYGNAIVPELAAEFVRAVMEYRP